MAPSAAAVFEGRWAETVVRLAAVGDLHIQSKAPLRLREELLALRGQVAALVIAGDITDQGRLLEAECAAELLRQVPVPVIAVLGNHDLRCLRRSAFRHVLEAAGVRLLDGQSTVVTADDGTRVGFAGVSGCGGGFWPIEGPDALHSRAFKALALRTRREAARLDAALALLDADLKVAVTHFAPTVSTLGREPIAKYWMLGNCELGRVMDRHAVDLALHGHAHLGNPVGVTIGGRPVRNVARPVNDGIVLLDLPGPNVRLRRGPVGLPLGIGA